MTKLLLTIAAFLLFIDSMNVLQFLNRPAKEISFVLNDMENEEEKSEESEVKKFDKNSHYWQLGVYTANNSQNRYHLFHTHLLLKGYSAPLYQPPDFV
ncbi:MAG: hypothetical protein SFU87_04365 [Chitinophagaceae bacterium]|nr:hypothetical protein [Chitinophagaceae bacterium]